MQTAPQICVSSLHRHTGHLCVASVVLPFAAKVNSYPPRNTSVCTCSGQSKALPGVPTTAVPPGVALAGSRARAASGVLPALTFHQRLEDDRVQLLGALLLEAVYREQVGVGSDVLQLGHQDRGGGCTARPQAPPQCLRPCAQLPVPACHPVCPPPPQPPRAWSRSEHGVLGWEGAQTSPRPGPIQAWGGEWGQGVALRTVPALRGLPPALSSARRPPRRSARWGTSLETASRPPGVAGAGAGPTEQPAHRQGPQNPPGPATGQRAPQTWRSSEVQGGDSDPRSALGPPEPPAFAPPPPSLSTSRMLGSPLTSRQRTGISMLLVPANRVPVRSPQVPGASGQPGTCPRPQAIDLPRFSGQTLAKKLFLVIVGSGLQTQGHESSRLGTRTPIPAPTVRGGRFV